MPEWLSWTAAIASIVGAVVSLGVFAAALAWGRRAQRLLEEVRVRTLSEELAALQHDAEQLTAALRSGHQDEARLLAQQVHRSAAAVAAREPRALNTDDIGDLHRVRGHVARIADALTAGPMGDEDVYAAVRRSRECGSLLATVRAHVQSHTGRSAEEG
ncbi:MAG: hypothetical protein FJX75_01765 [Armatimonadetes bacterium]|nr:hypothetical protein [Armatimonadota bacterium]